MAENPKGYTFTDKIEHFKFKHQILVTTKVNNLILFKVGNTENS